MFKVIVSGGLFMCAKFCLLGWGRRSLGGSCPWDYSASSKKPPPPVFCFILGRPGWEGKAVMGKPIPFSFVSQHSLISAIKAMG